ncbi:MAG: hypothetical protein A2V88_00780 [Elusimicrobia bacterium RBG_16_66_12]|nr:MAG: hypothetical protein A2V88_00780 [Elusimicrobia bacterium RBG_16_66_12]
MSSKIRALPAYVPPAKAPLWRQAANVLADRIVADPELTLIQVRLLVLVERQTVGYRRPAWYTSVGALAELIGADRGTVGDSLDRLQARGYLWVAGRGRGRRRIGVGLVTELLAVDNSVDNSLPPGKDGASTPHLRTRVGAPTPHLHPASPCETRDLPIPNIDKKKEITDKKIPEKSARRASATSAASTDRSTPLASPASLPAISPERPRAAASGEPHARPGEPLAPWTRFVDWRQRRGVEVSPTWAEFLAWHQGGTAPPAAVTTPAEAQAPLGAEALLRRPGGESVRCRILGARGSLWLIEELKPGGKGRERWVRAERVMCRHGPSGSGRGTEPPGASAFASSIESGKPEGEL